jgi:hypothetical protein
MPDRMFPDVKTLIRQIEATASDAPDPLAIMVALMKMVIASEADPYMLAGALIEGIAATVAQNIPPERQGDVAEQCVRLLRDRLAERGAI